MTIEKWIEGLTHEDFEVRSTSLAFFSSKVGLDESARELATAAAITAVEKWGWGEAYDYGNMIGNLPLTEGSAEWALDQVKTADFGDRQTMPLHLLRWIATVPDSLDAERKAEVSRLYSGLAKQMGWPAKDPWEIAGYQRLEAEGCEKKIREIVKGIASRDEYPHDDLLRIQALARRWVEVAPRDYLVDLVDGWLDADGWDWSCEEPWFICVAICLIGRLGLRDRVDDLIDLLDFEADCWSVLIEKALAEMLDDSMLEPLAERFMKLDKRAQLYLSSAISNQGRRIEVAPLLPVLKESPAAFEYGIEQVNIASAVVAHGSSEQLDVVNAWVREDMDNPEVEGVVLMLYSRYLLLGEEPACMDDYRDYVKMMRKNLSMPSPLMSMLSEISREKEMTDDETQRVMLSNLREARAGVSVVAEKKPGRNEPCPCGSGKKYKKCCGK